MKKIITLSLTAALLIFSSSAVNSFADEILLCVSEEAQNIVMVDSKEECLQDEDLKELSGTGLAEKKNTVPLANFKANDNCDGEGSVTEIGFDENGNSNLDPDEVMDKQSECIEELPE